MGKSNDWPELSSSIAFPHWLRNVALIMDECQESMSNLQTISVGYLFPLGGVAAEISSPPLSFMSQ